MDAKLRLAISTRLHQIFGTDPEAENFLSFPREAPYVFSPQELGLMLRENAADMAQAVSTMSNLSRTMNFPVRGIFYDNHGTDELLWDVYGEVLKTAEVAITRNEADEADLKRAKEMLYTTDEFGFQTPSERYQRYLDLRDRRFIAEQARDGIIAAGGEDKEGLAQAQMELDNIKKEMAAGNLEKDVLAMETIIERVTTNSPSTVWRDLQQKYNPDIQQQTNLELIEYAPTYIFPADILKQDWDSIELSKEEVDKLVKEAPEDLKKAFPSMGNSECGVKFEYRSVKLERPWFESKLFKSRNWRFPVKSGLQAISFGNHKTTGRFPAYITALFLVRNLKTDTGESLLEDGRVMSMAYVCKWLSKCPDPAPSASWGSDIKTVSLTISVPVGGKVIAKEGDVVVDSGDYMPGTVLTFHAIPDNEHVLDHWMVNGNNISAGNGTLVQTIPEEGLDITPIWSVARKTDGMQIVVNGRTLVSISGGPNDFNMDAYKETSNIETIGENAFSEYTNLHRIQIGSRVSSIGNEAFRGCKDLRYIVIPAATKSIAENAFLRDDNMDATITNVDENNDVYTAIDGQLVEKRRTMRLHTIRCKCGTSYFYSGPQPTTCPKCGAALEEKNATDQAIQVPDEVTPFKLVADEAHERINAFLKGKSYSDPTFRQAVEKADLGLKQVFIPCWEWNIQATGTFDVEVKKNVTSKDAEGKEVVNVVTEVITETASCPEERVTVPASRIMKSETLANGDRVKKEFAPTDTDLYEMYSCNSLQSLKTARKTIFDRLKSKVFEKIKELNKTVKRSDIEYTRETSILTALPYWLGGITFNDKHYNFVVDGYSGTVKTDSFPKDKKKIWKTVGIVAGIVAVITILIIILT